MTRFVNFMKAQREETPDEDHDPEESSSADVEKADQEAPGPAAAPRAPIAPGAAVAQTKQKKIPNKAPRLPVLNVTKSQAEHPCEVCGDPQFEKGQIALCMCLKELNKFVKSEELADGYRVEFGPEWSQTDLSIFVDMISGDSDGQ